MSVRIEVAADLQSVLHLGAVEIVNIDVQPASEALRTFCDQVAVGAVAESQNEQWEKQCQEVRQMLRFGKFKASGRSKPAQEYLLRCAVTDGKLPVINGPVDLLNAVSLSCNLPISLLSISKCSEELWIDRAKAGEQFVFNSIGQVIELTDLITTYDRSCQPPRPVGTPIKDSMAGKIESTDSHLIAIIYAPKNPAAIKRCHQAVELLADGMKSYCGTEETVKL
ncbi:MAG: hypothetical protein U0930_08000 [Pirellulales bacterium]